MPALYLLIEEMSQLADSETSTDIIHRYVSTYHRVMIWSSATRGRVEANTRSLFESANLPPPRLVWHRDHFKMPAHISAQDVQVYKQLTQVWEDKEIQSITTAAGDAPWDQTNTVLIDDGKDKAASEPHNLVEVPTFIRGDESTALKEAAKYLHGLRWQTNVSNHVKVSRPFTGDEVAEVDEYKAPFDRAAFEQLAWVKSYYQL